MALDRNFAVLLPAPNVWWHVVELNLFLQEQVHLALDGVLLSVTDEGSAEVERGHGVEVLVRTAEAAHDAEVSVEEVLAMTTIGDAVINNLLQNNFHGRLSVERQILTVAGHNLAEAL